MRPDFDWFFVDSNNFVACCTTASSDVYPEWLRSLSDDDLIGAENELDEPPRIAAAISTPQARPSAGALHRGFAERGLFSFEAENAGSATARYLLMAKPSLPLRATEQVFKLQPPRKVAWFEGDVVGISEISAIAVRSMSRWPYKT